MQYLFWPFLFHDVAAPAGAQDPLGIERFVMHGDDQHRSLRANRADVFDQFQPAFAGQADIHQDQIDFQPLRGGQGLPGVVRLAANGQIPLPFDQSEQAIAEHRVIIHDQDSFALFLP